MRFEVHAHVQWSWLASYSERVVSMSLQYVDVSIHTQTHTSVAQSIIIIIIIIS